MTAMLKQFLGSATLFALLTESAFANPVPLGSQYPQVNPGNQETLLCYIQTPDGRTLDLHDLCVKPTENEEDSSSQASNSSDNGSGSNFAAYSSCFLVDDQGRPCPSSD
ncbi:MAG: hypothetical protein VKL59_11895 [Nostocaceae cyanobacterium]|nr:hypothetical protein [Nostocaceae cyanobacterium]